MSRLPGEIRVNLLDWRAARREARQKKFMAMLGAGAFAGLLLGFSVMQVYKSQLQAQQDRNQRLNQEIKLTESKIREIKDLEKLREDLIARTQVIEKLQQSRAETVHFFDELVKTVPDGLYLTRVEQRSGDTQIDGIAESNGRVSTYIRNIEASEWIHQPRLVFIRAVERNRRRLSEFSLRVKVGPAADMQAPKEGFSE